MAQILLQTTLAGPDGCFPSGAVLTVGVDVTAKLSRALVDSGSAIPVEAPRAVSVPMETADAAPPETAMVQTSGKKARGR